MISTFEISQLCCLNQVPSDLVFACKCPAPQEDIKMKFCCHSSSGSQVNWEVFPGGLFTDTL